jgi:hypothetical protein
MMGPRSNLSWLSEDKEGEGKFWISDYDDDDAHELKMSDSAFFLLDEKK